MTSPPSGACARRCGPAARAGHGATASSLWSAADEQAHHVRRYRRRDLTQRFREAGLMPVRATSFVTFSLPAMFAARWRERRSDADFDPLAALVPLAPVNRALELSIDIERQLIRGGLNLSVGGSLLLVARR